MTSRAVECGGCFGEEGGPTELDSTCNAGEVANKRMTGRGGELAGRERLSRAGCESRTRRGSLVVGCRCKASLTAVCRVGSRLDSSPVQCRRCWMVRKRRGWRRLEWPALASQKWGPDGSELVLSRTGRRLAPSGLLWGWPADRALEIVRDLRGAAGLCRSPAHRESRDVVGGPPPPGCSH